MLPGGPPPWTLVPFPALVVAMALLPIAAPRLWERRAFVGALVTLLALPVVGQLVAASRSADLVASAWSYTSFVTTLTALYVAAGGVRVEGDLRATPLTNVRFVVIGALLSNVIGTTGASMLLVRPFLATNSQRANRAHLVPFFILAVSNAGGLLTPIGDPPLLVGYLQGVPFFWTLRLWPAWLLYVGTFAAALYAVDRRAYAREPATALERDRAAVRPLGIRGKRNLPLLFAVGPAALLPGGIREAVMMGIAATSYVLTGTSSRRQNDFSMHPMIDVAIVFAGVFACLPPIQSALVHAAPALSLHASWQFFVASGLVSAVLDNAPTYSAFAALAHGVGSRHVELVAGIAPLTLAAVSIGSVVMGAATYVGNGPNLIVKVLADRAGFPTPSFLRYAAFAFAVMLPSNAITALSLALLER